MTPTETFRYGELLAMALRIGFSQADAREWATIEHARRERERARVIRTNAHAHTHTSALAREGDR